MMPGQAEDLDAPLSLALVCRSVRRVYRRLHRFAMRNGEVYDTLHRRHDVGMLHLTMKTHVYRQVARTEQDCVKGGEIMYHLGGRALRCGV